MTTNGYSVQTPNGPGIAESRDDNGNIWVRHVIAQMTPTGAGANLTPAAKVKCLFAYPARQVKETK